MAYTQEQLDEAREALRLRRLGQQPVSVKYDGREVVYNSVSILELERYVSTIERSLAGSSGGRFTVYTSTRGLRS